MNLFKLMATLGLDDTEYKKKIADAEKSTEKMGGAVSKVGGVIKKAAIPVLVGAIGKSAIETGMDFEASMSQVAATMGMSAEEVRKGSKDFTAMEKAAREAGSTTKFTATEAAGALNNLALAGYDSSKAIDTLPRVLRLAEAGGIGLEQASAILTKSMNAMGLEAKDAGVMVDKMAVTAQKSGTTVAELGEGMLTVGGTAKNLAGGVTEMNTVLGIFADAGVMASEGGTALRNVILSMTAPTDKQAKVWKQLGIEVFDANGNMRPLNETFSELNGKLSEMNQEERINVLSNLFNKVDLKAVNALVANSGQRFDELSGYIDKSAGAGDKMAATMNDNLDGALKSLGSATDDLKVSIFKTFGEEAKGLVNTFSEGVRAITKAFEEGKLDNVLALIGAGLAGIITYLTLIKGYAIATAVIGMVKTLVAAAGMIKSVSGAMAILNTVMMANPIGLLIGLIAGLVAAFVYLWNTQEWFRDLWKGAWEAIKGAFQWAWDGIKAGWDAMKQDLEILKQKLAEWGQWWSEKWQAIKDFFSGIWEWIKGQWNNMIQWFVNLGNKLQELKDKWSQRWDEIKQKTREVVDSIVNFFKELPGKIWNIFTQVIQKATTWVFEMGKKGGEAGRELFNAVWNAIKTLPSKVLELGKKIPSMLWDGIKGAGAWLGNSVKNWVSGLFSFNLFSLGLPEEMANFTATNSYAMAVANNARGLNGSNIGGLSQTTNVSLNIAGREFDQLVIKSVANNYGKIENIVQSKERGRR